MDGQRSEKPLSQAIWRVVLIGFFGAVCGFIGMIYGNIAPYENRLVAERAVANQIIESRPEFKNIRLLHSSKGMVVFSGSVPSEQALPELKAEVSSQFGQIDLRRRMHVRVAY
jgi:hypothetical protein